MTGKLYEKKGKYYVVLNIKDYDGKWKKKVDFNRSGR